MENTPLQTLLDERASDFEDVRDSFKVYDTSLHQYVIDDKVVLDFLQESILQGVRLGLAMGRECVAPEDRGEYRAEENKEAQAVWNECRKMTLDRLEAKEKELGVLKKEVMEGTEGV